MNRLVFIFVLLFLPLHTSWAAVAAYCTHENDASTQHFGHHVHKHHASPGDQSGDPARGGGGLDRDCGFCQLNLKLAHATATVTPLVVVSRPDSLAPMLLFSSFVSPGLERPNWRDFA
jgi:hypothetical protein